MDNQTFLSNIASWSTTYMAEEEDKSSTSPLDLLIQSIPYDSPVYIPDFIKYGLLKRRDLIIDLHYTMDEIYWKYLSERFSLVFVETDIPERLYSRGHHIKLNYCNYKTVSRKLIESRCSLNILRSLNVWIYIKDDKEKLVGYLYTHTLGVDKTVHVVGFVFYGVNIKVFYNLNLYDIKNIRHFLIAYILDKRCLCYYNDVLRFIPYEIVE